MKIGGKRGEVIFYKFKPNGQTYDITQAEEAYAPTNSSVDNIIVLMSSSAYGDKFWGAPGSRLDIKDIEFVY
ncbi:MAG: PCMD domain-containing protein [Bacteroidales bacterium]